MNKKWATTFSEIIGAILVSVGAYQIFEPLGLVVAGALIIVASEMSA